MESNFEKIALNDNEASDEEIERARKALSNDPIIAEYLEMMKFVMPPGQKPNYRPTPFYTYKLSNG